jgi:hypothetical protein
MLNHFITPILMDGFPMVPKAWTWGDAMVWEISPWQLTNEKIKQLCLEIVIYMKSYKNMQCNVLIILNSWVNWVENLLDLWEGWFFSFVL